MPLSTIYGRSLVPLIVIASAAGALSVITYYYSSGTLDAIADISSSEIRANAESQAHDLSQILTNSLDSATTNLQLLSNSPSLLGGNKEADVLFDVAQDSTKELTHFYMWLDSDGKITWITGKENSGEIGHDRSYRDYFTMPTKTLQPYFSDVIVGSDRVPLVYIAYPAIDTGEQPGELKGVVIAAIGLDAITHLVQTDQSTDSPRSRVLILDNSGTILYSVQTALIGQNVNESTEQIGNLGLPREHAETIAKEIRNVTFGAHSSTLSTNEGLSTVASEPVMIDGTRIWTVFVTTPHTFVSDVRILFDQQNNFSTLMVLLIGILAVGIGFFILSSKKRLEYLVELKTSELKNAVRSLEGSNSELAKVNSQLCSANEQLEIHDKLQKEFINIASHEMKTPTQAILFHSDIISKKPNSSGSLDAIVRNAKRLQRLSNNILDVTRIESQALKLNTEIFDMNELISTHISDYKVPANSKVEISLECDGKTIVAADRARVTQVISNIIGNALEFTKRGMIAISVESSDGQAIVRISDSGPGIDPEVMPKLFSKFVTKSEKGTGLGLFIARSIIEAHRGKIWAENNVNGATFVFTLPLAKDSSEWPVSRLQRLSPLL
jgi:signal transduction histidine kinase